MNIQINPSLDFQRLRQEFLTQKRLRIDDFLRNESAEYILHGLQHETQWHLVHSDKDGLPVRYNAQEYAELSDRSMSTIDQKLHALAADHYQYKYRFFPIIDELKAGRLTSNSVHLAIANFVNSTEFIGFARALTGVNSLVKMDPQASLYQSGDFLTMHDDSNYQRRPGDTSSRRFAVVFGFTKNWSANWGGQTSFYAKTDSPNSISWSPGFNKLTIFEVPTQHLVTFVTPFATSGRYSITGWLRDDPTVSRPDLGDQ